MKNTIITNDTISNVELLSNVTVDSAGSNRRTFLQRGSVAAVALAAAGVWSGQHQTAKAADDGRSDTLLLQEAFTFSQRMYNTYAALASQKGSGGEDLIVQPELKFILRLRDGHRAHATQFKEVLGQIGGSVPADATETTLQIDGLKPSTNTTLISAQGITRYGLAVEVHFMKLWVDYSQYCEDDRARRTFLDVASSMGARVAVIRSILKHMLSVPTDYDNVNVGLAIVPHAFVSLDAPVF